MKRLIACKYNGGVSMPRGTSASCGTKSAQKGTQASAKSTKSAKTSAKSTAKDCAK